MDDLYITRDVNIYKNKKFILGLGTGITYVEKFYKLAVEGIEGALRIEESFGYNIDVDINGGDLLKFISKEYPKDIDYAKKVIKTEETYTIVCYDMS